MESIQLCVKKTSELHDLRRNWQQFSLQFLDV
jgi:hypothetical protein